MTDDDAFKVVDYDTQVKQVGYYRRWCYAFCIIILLQTLLDLAVCK